MRWSTGSREGRDPGSPRDGKKCNSALYLLLYLFIVLNEMFPLVFFLVGYVENNFRKYCCNSYVGGSCVTKNETHFLILKPFCVKALTWKVKTISPEG